MANYAILKSTIEDNIKQNGTNAITGPVLQSALLAIVNSLGAEFQFGGEVVPTDNPGTSDYKVAYLAATPGTYSNFGGLVVDEGEVAILKGSGTSWEKDTTGIASADELLQQTHKMAANAILLRGFNASQRFGGAIGSTGKWQNLGTAKHIIIPVSPGDVVLVNPATATYAAAVTEYVTPKNGESLLYSSDPNFSAQLALSHSVANTYTMPADAKFFVLVVAGSSGVEISINALMLNSDNLLISQAQDDSRQNAVILDAARSNPICLSIPGLRDEPGIIDANGKWAQVTSADYAHVTIPLKGGQAVHLKAGSRDTQFAFVRSYVTPNTNGESVDFSTAAGYTGRILLTEGTSANHTVPADAVALVLMTIANGSRMVAEFTIDGFDVLISMPRHIDTIADGLSITSGLVLDVVTQLSTPIIATIPQISGLMFDGEKFVSGVDARIVHYLQCPNYTILELRGELLNATRPIYYGYSDAVPAANGTMVVLGIIDTEDVFTIKTAIPAGKYFCFAENSSYTRNIAFYKYQLNTAGPNISLAAYYDDRILDTEYSALTEQPNSLYFFQQALTAGFRAFKADMRLTSDNKIVLCHDAGFTFDGNGRIIDYDAENATLIHDLTFAQVKELEFAEQAGGNYIHPGTLDDFLVFCKRNRCVPYLTFRNEYIADTANALWASLTTYKMEQKAIINLYPLNVNIIQALQSKQLYWLICNTRQTTIPLSQELIDETALNGCSYLCIYQDMRSSITPALVQYAASKNVRIWVCGFPTAEDLAAGVTGFQDFHQYPIV